MNALMSDKIKLNTIIDYEAIRQASLQAEYEKRQAEKLEQALKIVPLRFRDQVLSDFREDYPAQTHIKRIIERYISTFPERLSSGNNLIFCGHPGTGKTMLSLLLYQALARAGFSVGYESSLQFLHWLKEKEFESEASFNSLLKSYLNKSLLIIDEITEGISKGSQLTESERKLLFTLINARYERKLCTIAITNRSKEGMIMQLGEPIVGRLAEDGMFMAFNWNSYRKQKGE